MTNGAGVVPQKSGTATVVFPPPNSNNEVVVKYVSIGTSPTVDFINKTGGSVRLWIPRGTSLFVPPTSGQDFNDLGIKDGVTLTLFVLETPTNGVYPYHVYCDSIEDYAQGGSPPAMSYP